MYFVFLCLSISWIVFVHYDRYCVVIDIVIVIVVVIIVIIIITAVTIIIIIIIMTPPLRMQFHFILRREDKDN